MNLFLKNFFFSALLLLIVVDPVFGLPEKVSIRGSYNDDSRTFTGEVVYQFASVKDKTLYFHLPPNWYAEDDEREEYSLNLGQDEKTRVSRSELKTLKKDVRENFFLPKGIIVQEVLYDDITIPFSTLHNLDRPPLQSARDALILFVLPATALKVPFTLTIKFKTYFQDIPGGWKRILWDYVPRPVYKYENRLDFADTLQYPLATHTAISRDTPNGEGGTIQKVVEKRLPIPMINLGETDLERPKFSLTLIEQLQDKRFFLAGMVEEIFDVFKKEDWQLFQTAPYHFHIWPGPLTVSGSNILLPYRLSRYHQIFRKLMESNIIKGTVEAALLHNYALDRRRNPWILPAVYAEFVRSYFEWKYHGDVRYFPWADWLNPGFYQENTINRWLDKKSTFKTIAASDHLDFSYYSNIYHPWYEKGFHLLRNIYSGERSFREDMYPRINRLLLNGKKNPVLDNETFFAHFAASPELKNRGMQWLSKKGSVDYALRDVSIKKQSEENYQVTVAVESRGTLSPVYELAFKFEKDRQIIRVFKEGAGKHTLTFTEEPKQIYLDPRHVLLENDSLNNSWNMPLKIRPLWDFPTANKWLFTYYPLVDGNTFDQNLLGLRFQLSYMYQTGVSVDIWKRSKDGKTLFSSSLFHTGFPWKGTMLYLDTTQLNATDRIILGMKQHYGEKNPIAWSEFYIWQETLQQIEGKPVPEGQESWIGAHLAGNFTLAEFAYTKLESNLYANTSQNLSQTKRLRYQQQGLVQKIDWRFNPIKMHIHLTGDTSQGTVPLHKQFPMGGPEGMPGFPRKTKLLFNERFIFEGGITFPGLFKNNRINLVELIWLDKIVPTLNYHYGVARKEGSDQLEEFQDIELKLDVWGELIVKYTGFFTVSIAQPIGHEEYKDPRIIFFSNWVF